MKKLKNVICLMLIFVMMFSLGGCGEKVPTGDVNPQLTKIEEDDIPEDVLILDLNNSIDYYELKIDKDVKTAYFYAIGFNDMDRLIDKSVITTLPVGMKKDTTVVINGTIPKVDKPNYAMGFELEDGTHEYYYIQHNKKGKLTTSLIEDVESFFISENNETVTTETDADSEIATE